MEFFLVVGAVILFFWGVGVMRRGREANERAARQAAQFQADSEVTREKTENRALELMVEFPALNDNDIALLLRDELIANRSTHRVWMQWATTETVSRMRRTLAVYIERRRREAEKLKG